MVYFIAVAVINTPSYILGSIDPPLAGFWHAVRHTNDITLDVDQDVVALY